MSSPEEPKCFESHYHYLNNDSVNGRIPEEIDEGPFLKSSHEEASMVREGIERGIASVSVYRGIAVVWMVATLLEVAVGSDSTSKSNDH